MSDGHLSARTTAHRKHVCRRPTVAPTTLRCERHGIYAIQPQPDSRVWVYTGKRASMGAREKSLDRMRRDLSSTASARVSRVSMNERLPLGRFVGPSQSAVPDPRSSPLTRFKKSTPPRRRARRSGGNIFSVHIHTTPRGTISVMKNSEAVYTSCPPSTSRRATDRPTARRGGVEARRRDTLSGHTVARSRPHTRARARTHAS